MNPSPISEGFDVCCSVGDEYNGSNVGVSCGTGILLDNLFVDD